MNSKNPDAVIVTMMIIQNTIKIVIMWADENWIVAQEFTDPVAVNVSMVNHLRIVVHVHEAKAIHHIVDVLIPETENKISGKQYFKKKKNEREKN